MNARTPDRYGSDVLGARQPAKPKTPLQPAERGLIVEEVDTGRVGEVLRVENIGGDHLVIIEDRHGRELAVPLGPGYLVEGRPVSLVRPKPKARATAPRRTASGSVAVPDAPARTARASRIWVEGRHDAELIERVWGDDLRIEGIVVEPLGGIDDLAAHIADFGPAPHRRLGILVDHLVEGSKESRIVAEALAGTRHRDAVLVLGHPFIDVWQAIRPERVGLTSWPHVPRGTDIKVGSLRALGLPADSQADIAHGWQKILGRVRGIADLDPELSGRVEHLIDFTTITP